MYFNKAGIAVLRSYVFTPSDDVCIMKFYYWSGARGSAELMVGSQRYTNMPVVSKWQMKGMQSRNQVISLEIKFIQ